MSHSIIGQARSDFHRELVESGTLSVSKEGIASNADKSQFDCSIPGSTAWRS